MKLLKNIFPEDLSIAGKVYHPKGQMMDILDKWEKTTPVQRLVGVGMKLIAHTIYPVWRRAAQAVGQPHFFTALEKGLNPRRIIQPDSDIGQVAGITKPTRFGTQGVTPQWRQSEDFNQMRKLQNAAVAKQEKMESLAWLMASMAVAEKTDVGPMEILTYGVTSQLEGVERVHNDTALQLDMLWVMKHLLKEIQALDELDIRKALVELDPEKVVRYYERAKQLAEEVNSHSDFKKKVRELWHNNFYLNVVKELNFRNFASFNKERYELLMDIPTMFVAGRFKKEFWIDHGWVVLFPIIVTERADFISKYMAQLSIDPRGAFGARGQHFNEIIQNIYVHMFAAGAGRTLVFTDKSTIIGEAQKKISAAYEAMEKHQSPMKPHVQKEGSYYGRQLDYIFRSGGEPGNLGDIWWRSFVTRMAGFQHSMALFIGTRMMATPYGFFDSLKAYLLFFFAAHWIFNWPWDALAGGDNRNLKFLEKNKEKMESLQLQLSKVVRGIYTQESELKKEYKESVNEIIKLYSSTEEFRKRLLDAGIKEVNPELGAYIENTNVAQSEWPASENRETMQLTSEKLKELLVEFPPLPNEKNHLADAIYTFALAGVMTNILFVMLSVWTFSSEHLTWRNIGLWIFLNFFGFWLANLYYKRSWKEHREFIRNWRTYMNDRKGEMNEWMEAIKGLKTPEESWRSYFYGRVLNLNTSIRNTCRRAFKKTGS